MGFYRSLLRPLAFAVDPERVHELAMAMVKQGVVPGAVHANPVLTQNLFGVEFANPVGLAAGFDKNAEAIDRWHRYGFGFVECGTITWHAQPGNPRPRLFRLPADQALINRMGFNNDGATAVAGRLAEARPQLRLGINLGKSKITELIDAPTDYANSYRALRTYGDYFVINVSSPNTPGLRSLQEKGPLLEIIAAIRAVDAEKPLFVKIAPDLEWEAIDDVISVANEAQLTGIIAVNTTIRRDGVTLDPKEVGGLSGRPLRERGLEVLRYLTANTPTEMIRIGVGGIMDGDDAYLRLASGAQLVQLYTGWIYGGPMMVAKMLAQIVVRLEQAGVRSLPELRALAAA
jgi:dihydroorotate dehydrogenase